MNTENNHNDAETDSNESSRLEQDERSDKKLYGEFGFAALPGQAAFFSAVLATVVEGYFREADRCASF